MNLQLIWIKIFFAICHQLIYFLFNPVFIEEKYLLSHYNSNQTNLFSIFSIYTFYKNFTIEDKFKGNLERAEQLLQQGIEQYQSSQFEAAIESWQQALILYKKLQNRKGEGAVFANFGIAYRALGNYTKAIDYLEQALAVQQELNDQKRQLIVLANLGNAYESIGQSEQAIENYQQSLQVAQSIGDVFGEGVALGSLGIVFASLGDYKPAIQYYQQSLKIAQQIGDREGEGYTLNNLGLAYHIMGDVKQALIHYKKSLEIAQLIDSLPMQTAALGSLGLAYENLNDYDKAIEYHQQSLVIANSMKAPREQAKVLNNLAHTLYKSANFVEAEKKLRLAIQILDSLRSELNDAQHISIFDTQALTYNLLQQVLIAKNSLKEALEISEHGRSRAFIALLSKQLSSNLNVAVQTIPPNIQQIQQIAQSQNVTLVEYSIIPDDSFLVHGKLRGVGAELFIWVVKPSGEVAFRRSDLKSLDITLTNLVPSSRISLGVRSRGETESLALTSGDLVRLKDDPPDWEPWQVVKINEATQEVELTQSSFAEGVTISRPMADVVTKVDSRSSSNLHLQQLHQLLIAPVADLLPANPEDHVVFIPHGELFLVPFAALQDSEGNYLIEKHTILTAPAIQVLDLTNQQKQQLPTQTQPQALVVGNPKMPVVSTTPGQPAQPLAPLPNAEIEALEIARLLQTTALTGAIPTKALVVEKMQQSQIIHFATHGLLDEAQGLESAIALAPDSKDNGLLTASEILNLKLKAELIVLSACNTGRGRITGDGVIGLSRALISAGIPSAVVSLWTVPDAPTAFLMQEFYQQLQQNGDKAKALRSAMLKTIQQHPNPRDWAAFILIGQP